MGALESAYKEFQEFLAKVSERRAKHLATTPNTTPPSLGESPRGESGELKPKDLEYYGIYRRFQNVTFRQIEAQGLPSNPVIRRHYRIIKEYADHLAENVAKGKGLILLGACGTMKTTLSVAVMRVQIARGSFCYFIPMTTLMDWIFTRHAMNKEDCARFEHRIRTTQLLVVDDLGSENTDVGWVRSKVDSILTERYNRMLPCIITSNLTFEEMKGTYEMRLIDRLRHANMALMFTGESLRKSGQVFLPK